MRWRTVLVGACVAALVPMSGADVPALPRAPAVELVAAMPDDLKALVRVTWDRFLRAFPGQTHCIDDIVVAGAWELNDRASYEPDERTVNVRIPATARNLQASLVHEFAHHLDSGCGRTTGLRIAFREAQGLPATGAWWSGPTWELTPAEHFAEGAARYVLGNRSPHSTIPITSNALTVIRSWATFGDISTRP